VWKTVLKVVFPVFLVLMRCVSKQTNPNIDWFFHICAFGEQHCAPHKHTVTGFESFLQASYLWMHALVSNVTLQSLCCSLCHRGHPGGQTEYRLVQEQLIWFVLERSACEILLCSGFADEIIIITPLHVLFLCSFGNCPGMCQGQSRAQETRKSMHGWCVLLFSYKTQVPSMQHFTFIKHHNFGGWPGTHPFACIEFCFQNTMCLTAYMIPFAISTFV
jgi:hypothetical protein